MSSHSVKAIRAINEIPVGLPRKKQLLIMAVPAIILASIGLMGSFSQANQAASPVSQWEVDSQSVATEKKTNNSFRPTAAQLADFKVAAVKSQQFTNEVVTDGNIAINEDTSTPVFSPYSGKVSKLIAKLGDVVKSDDPLFAVEASEFVQGQNDLVNAVVTLGTTKSQLKLAETTEQRQHALYQAKSGALKDWLQSQSDLNAAKNAVEVAETTLAAARDRLRILGMSASEIATTEKSLKVRPSPEAIVRAPIAGTVIQRQVGLGQYINSAATGANSPVYTITDLSTVWLIGNVREVDAPAIQVGQSVEVAVAAFPGRTFNAKVSWIAPSVDPVTRRVTVRAEVDNSAQLLKPQMIANFRIFAGNESTSPAVPQSAIVYDGTNVHVWVALDDGTVTARNIHVGRTHGAMVEVSEGLSAGEKIVTTGTLFIDRAAEGDAT